MKDEFYEEVYRRLNPPSHKFGIGRRAKLADLWEIDQQKFRDIVDQTLKTIRIRDL